MIRPALTSAAAGLVLLQGCAPAPAGADGPADESVTVVVTMTILLDPVVEVGGAHVEARSIVHVGGDPHSYEPLPSDAAAIADADLVVDNGFGLSPWFEGALDANVEGELLRLSDEAPVETIIDDEGRPDPHAWTSPLAMADYATAIAEKLASVDPSHAEAYQDNLEDYRGELAALDDDLGEILAGIPAGRRLLVTYENAYNHFARHYGFEIVGTVVGVTTEEEPSARDLRQLLDLIDSRGVPAVFPQVGVNPAVMERLANDAGVTLGGELYVDSLGEPGSEADTYEGMMRSNAHTLVAGLGGA